MLSDPLALATATATSRRPRSISRAQSIQQVTEVPQHALQQLIKLMPKVSRPSWFGALVELVVCLSLFTSSILLFTYLPWFLVPLGWLVAGGALSAAYVIGRDCAYGCYTPSRVFNRIVGELVFLPLSQPFELFRLEHVSLNYNKEQHMTFMEQLKQQQEQQTQQQQTTTNNNNKPLQRSPSGKKLIAPPVPVVDGVKVFVTTGKTTTKIMTSAILCVVFLALSIHAIIQHAGIKGLFIYWVAPMLTCRLMFAAWQAMTQHVISMLPSEVSVTIASYHMLTLALSIRHSIDSRLMKLHEVIAWYLRRIDPVNTTLLLGIPAIGAYGVCTVPLRTPTLIFSLIFYMFAGLGITAGYHRLWAHRSYKASRFVEIFLMLCGSAALEGSIKWWCGGHRVHHRYTDTPKDPYNAQGGFWYAHIGWMLVKPDPKNKAFADIHDLKEDKLIQLQHKYYLFFGPFMAFVFPTLVCGLLWGDWMGGYFYGGALRAVAVHHSTFCVNSVAHYFGAQTYDDDRSPRDHIVTALLTFGEGYHNFHHEFPNDYRNGIRWYDYDPTKWLIEFFHLCGLTYELKTFPSNEIAKGQALMIEKNIQKQIQALNERKCSITYPAPVDTLPCYTYAEFQSSCKKEGKQWIIINDLIHDVADFINQHPGGKTFIASAVGQDATERFQGKTGIYKHSHAAHNLLDNMRCGRIVSETQ